MRRSWGQRLGAFALGAVLVGGAAIAPPTQAVAREASSDEALRDAVSFARDRVYPALVNILVVDRAFSQGRETRVIGAGSGVIVSPAGHVVTNFHVAGTAARLTCKLPTGEMIDADIVCPDPLTDLCVLKLQMEERANPNEPLPFASIGDSERLRVGDHIMAMGNPQSLSSSITLGIVSNTERVFTSFTGDRIESLELGSGQQTGIFNQWIQHDALILPGNSGGPLVNMKGEVVGINTRGGGGVGFAIPATIVKKVLNQALTFGEVKRGWFGVSVLPRGDEIALGGALVSSALPSGPAYKAGVRPGDVIRTINDKPVDVNSLADVPLFLARVADLAPGRDAEVVVDRKGERKSFTVAVAKMEKLRGEQRAYRIWGVSASEITAPLAVARGWPNTKGVLLRTMRPGGAPDAAKPPLTSGDVVLEIAGKPVDDLEAFGELMRKHKRSKALPVRFRRDKADMMTVLDLSKKPRRRGSAELAKAWLGLKTQVLTPKIAKAMDLGERKGFRVTWVLPGTEAEKGGIQAGDVIVALDGEALEASALQDAQMLTRKVEDMDIGGEIELTVVREGAEQKLKVMLEENPGTAADVRSASDDVLEYKVRELTYMDRVEKDLDLDFEGLVVADVENGGWASVAGLRVSDVLLEVQGAPVRTISAFKKLVKRLAKEEPARVRIFVRRGRSTTFVFMRPEWPQD